MFDRLQHFEWHKDEPLNYVDIYKWRYETLELLRSSSNILQGAFEYYAEFPAQWITHWCTTFDPRLAADPRKTTRLPFILFRRQFEWIDFLHMCVTQQADGLVEKSRDTGLTWLCCAYSMWMWRFWKGAAIGWGSREQDLVDKLGDPQSIFEKMRLIVRGMPPEFYPSGFNPMKHMSFMRIINPETGAAITGDIGDNIGRGGRTLVTFKDESAHYEHPEAIEAALSENTRCQIDISSVHGLGTVFHRKRSAGIDWVPGAPVIKGKTNVFVMDWRDHPEKTQEWYDTKRAKAESEGLLHLFAQEVDRDYASSLEGVIIKSHWVKAAIDAHITLGFDDSGAWLAGLDVADEGGDTNALATRKGVILKSLEEWGDSDIGVTSRRAIATCGLLPVPARQAVALQYDAVGIGAGVKAEANRLADANELPSHVVLVPWFAGAKVLDPEERLITLPNGMPDLNSPLNKDFYDNFKAQAWWEAGRRFNRTYRAVNAVKARRDGDTAHPDYAFTWRPDELISLPSSIPLIRKLQQELSQAVVKYGKSLKMLVDKKPEGSKSPNLADALIMAFWPADHAGIMLVSPEAMAWSKGMITLKRAPEHHEPDVPRGATLGGMQKRLHWSMQKQRRRFRM